MVNKSVRGRQAQPKLLAVIATAALISSVSVPIAFGSSERGDVRQETWRIDATGQVDISPDEMFDIEMTAADLGISLDEAIERFGWQNAFAAGASRF